ncbi:MAG: carbohydrate-binding domain-containing protein [Fibrobacter sp.]|nr:carbohydrate-binding domain-containing protein [Fibrobacter sp.]
MKTKMLPVIAVSAIFGLVACGDDDNDLEDARVLDGTQILLRVAGTTATVENNNGCVVVENQSATITCPGAYYVTGESSDFQIVVNTPAVENEGNTGIYLYNAILKSSNSPILVKNADKAVLHLVKGTTNLVEDGAGDHLFTTVNGKPDTAKAAIYSKDDMNIKGAGTLTVTGNFKNGIQSSNDLKIKNGNITVVAEANGIKGKGSLEITGGVLLAFGDYTTDVPSCTAISYTSDNYYGSGNAAFKPNYTGNTILYGGEVQAVGPVETTGMTEFKFPNGASYMYK